MGRARLSNAGRRGYRELNMTKIDVDQARGFHRGKQEPGGNTPLSRVELARLGEELACRHLLARGYEILGRNCRFRNGEIDLIVRDGPTVVFVEVKTRSGTRFKPCE